MDPLNSVATTMPATPSTGRSDWRGHDALCGVPTVLKKMSDDLDWTRDLGDAFLAQKADVMDTVQRMRGLAYEAGNLKTSKEQTVTVQEDKIIVIQAADPEVIYVPTYNPTVVYGPWLYPAFPPFYLPPPPGYWWSVAIGTGIAASAAGAVPALTLTPVGGPDSVRGYQLRALTGDGHKVFLDLKYHDIPNTVAMAGIALAIVQDAILDTEETDQDFALADEDMADVLLLSRALALVIAAGDSAGGTQEADGRHGDPILQCPLAVNVEVTGSSRRTGRWDGRSGSSGG